MMYDDVWPIATTTQIAVPRDESEANPLIKEALLLVPVSKLSANFSAGKKGLCDYVATNQVGTSTWKGVPLDSQASQQWGQWLVLFDVLLWLYHTWMGVQNKIDVETTTTTTTTIIIDIARNGITYHITMKYHTYSHIKTILIYIYIYIYISILISIESDDIWNYHSGG